MALQFLDRYEHAQTLLDQARAGGHSTTQVTLPSLTCAQMWQDFNLGHLDDADAQARAIIELGQQLGNGIHAMDAIIIRVDLAWDEYHRIGAWAWRADTQRVMREASARRAKWSTTTLAPRAGRR